MASKLGGEVGNPSNSANDPEDPSNFVIGRRSEIDSSDKEPDNDHEFNSMVKRVEELPATHEQRLLPSSSIYKVPSRLRELNEDAYTPRIVSIGPIHFGKENLQPMEVHKTRYMKSLFQRTINDQDQNQTFYECVRAILRMGERARSCYDRCPNYFYDVRRLEDILLVDGCFLLELFFRWRFPDNSEEIISRDPIFGAATICSIQRDLALLENQIPFFVLQHLFNIIKGSCRDKKLREDQISLTQLCASFFYLEIEIDFTFNEGTHFHLLDMIRFSYVHPLPLPIPLPLHLKNPSRNTESNALKCFMPLNSWTKRQKPITRRWELIHCVTKLRESGIKFAAKGTSKNLFDIKFNPNLGVFQIPKLCMDDTMDSLLRNMIAFEQCHHGIGHHITSYAVLMDCLIDTPADAEFLQHKRIIANYLGHGEEVSNIFNKISKKVFVEHFYFDALCKQVNEFCDNYCWPKKREIFVRDYWISPWKFIGVVAASMLLLLTAFQTGYTIATFYAHHN